ncbi:MFS transporter [Microbacterium sp. Mu-80]|uniref:MFS transporter n=1 Tax=Microbacterium bandirmense TaxID=3122050 RepID=A0ABU8L923_9MICO
MLSSLQFTLVVPVLPRIPELLGTSAADASWLMTITLLIGVVGTPVITRLADMHGRRRMLLTALGLLVGGSFFAAVVPGFAAVMIGRALQGFGTAVVPIGIALMSATVSRDRATLGIALMSGTLGIGSALGLAVAGPLVAWGGLSTIFWVSGAIGAIFLVLVLLRIRETPAASSGRFDHLGAVLLAIGLTALLLAISRGQAWQWTSPITLGLIATAAAVLPLWLLWERRHPHPMIDVRIAMTSPVLPINLASFVATFGMYANHLLTTQEALSPSATGYGLAAATATAGAYLLPSAVVMVLLSPIAARVISRFGGRVALMLGAGIMAGAFVFRMLVHSDPIAVMIGSGLVGVGVAFAFAAMPSLITASVPSDQIAAANGVNSVVRTLSGAVAAALFAFVIATLPSPVDDAYLSHFALVLSFGTAAACGIITVVIAAFLRLPENKEHA